MKKNVIIMGLALVILAMCAWIGYEAEREERIESMMQDYIVAENGDGNYEVEILGISDGEVEYTYDGDASGFGYVSVGYLESTAWNS